MDLDTNIGARIIGAIICIVIGVVSFQIVNKTYNRIDNVSPSLLLYKSLDSAILQMLVAANSSEKEIKDYVKWHKKEVTPEIDQLFLNHIQSNRHTILYSSVFVFCVSLCCFTYICVKK